MAFILQPWQFYLVSGSHVSPASIAPSCDRAGHEEVLLEVEQKLVVPGRRVELEQRRPARSAHDVDEAIDAPERLHCTRDRFFRGRFVRHVADKGVRVATLGPEFSGDGLYTVRLEIYESERTTGAGQMVRRAAADALTRADDQQRTVLQSDQ